MTNAGRGKVAKPIHMNRLNAFRRYKYFFFMLMPVFAYYLIFKYATIYGNLIAFKNYNPLLGVWNSPWNHFKSFERIFKDMFFLSVLRNTVVINLLKLIFGFPAPIVLAVMLNEVRSVRFKRTVQTISYLPYFLSWVVLSGIVIEVLSPSRGIINYFIQMLGFEPIYFVANAKWFRTVLVASDMWRNVGYGSIVYLAAISGIDQELYDVADLDGAGRIRKIINITIPCIWPVIIIMFIFATGNIINDDFEQIFNLLNDKVRPVGDVLSTYTYQVGLVQMDYSYSTAVSFFKSVVAFALVMTTNFIAKKTGEYSLL